jgi:hypothetical protein
LLLTTATVIASCRLVVMPSPRLRCSPPRPAAP